MNGAPTKPPSRAFTVGLSTSAGNDPDAVAEVAWRVAKAGPELFVSSMRFERNKVSVTIDPPLAAWAGVVGEEFRQRTARRLADLVREAVGASRHRARVVTTTMGDWAFGSDKRELSAEQRAKVREEVLALLAESAPHEQALIKRIADKVGRR